MAVALVLGLFFSVFPPSRAAALGSAQRFPACHQFAVSVGATDQTVADARDRDTAKHGNIAHCPDCCLAAHGGSIVLPLRGAAFARPRRIEASRFRYFTLSERASNLAPIDAANGARAPPAA